MKFIYYSTICLALCACVSDVLAQESGTMKMIVASDTVKMGEPFELSYEIVNIEGKFASPELTDFQIVGGPNMSSQYSSMNGETFSKVKYTYFLAARSPGVATIGEARMEIDGAPSIKLDSQSIIVLDEVYNSDIQYGSPIFQDSTLPRDTLSESQRTLLKKMKKGKRRKI